MIAKSNTLIVNNNRKTKPALNDFGFEEDGNMYWWATWYARILGYKSLKTLESTIKNAKNNCTQIGLEVGDNFIKVTRKIDSKKFKDFKLTKFACFLIAMHADMRKPAVRNAQVYFLNEFEELNLLAKDQGFAERRIAREEIKELNSQLNRMAARSRVKDFSYFINEGFIGMYNSTVRELKERRGLSNKDNLYDYIGVTELAAHIFRITMTTERLKHLNNLTEQNAAREHWKIGAQIRAMIKENAGVYPEYLVIKDNLPKLEKKLRKASERLNSIENRELERLG